MRDRSLLAAPDIPWTSMLCGTRPLWADPFTQARQLDAVEVWAGSMGEGLTHSQERNKKFRAELDLVEPAVVNSTQGSEPEVTFTDAAGAADHSKVWSAFCFLAYFLVFGELHFSWTPSQCACPWRLPLQPWVGSCR